MRDIQPDILAALYGGVTDAGRLDQALALLCEEFDSPSITLLSLDLQAPGADIWAARGVFGRPEVLEAHSRTFSAVDPAPAAFAQNPSLGATATDQMIAQGRIREGDARTRTFLNEFFWPIGLEECLGANLATRNGQTALIGLHRGGDRKAFTPEEVALLERYTPHLAQALQLRRSVGQAQTRASLLSEVVERMAAGVVIRDREGRVAHCNRAALDIAARGDGLSISRDGFPYSTVPAATRALRRLCAGIGSGGSGGVVSFPRKHAALPYTLLVTPVTEGEDASAYAERRGISGNAIKFHFRTAFSRTGFRRQADLLKAVMRAISDLGRRG